MSGFDRRGGVAPLSLPAENAGARRPGGPAWPGQAARPFDAPAAPEAAPDAAWPHRPRPRAREPRATPVDVHVGTRVRLARIRRGLSQGALAEALGITFQQVQRYEQGTNRIGASRLFDLATALAMPIAFFFDGADPEERGGPAAFPGPAPQALPDAGSPERKEALDLIRTYDRILDPEVRRQVLSLVRTIAQGEGEGGRGHGPGGEAIP